MIIRCELCKHEYDTEEYDVCTECGYENEDLIESMRDEGVDGDE